MSAHQSSGPKFTLLEQLLDHDSGGAESSKVLGGEHERLQRLKAHTHLANGLTKKRAFVDPPTAFAAEDPTTG